MKSVAQCQAHHILNSIINMLTGGSLLLFSALSVEYLIFFFFIHLCSFQLIWLRALADNFLNCFILQTQNTVVWNSFGFGSEAALSLAFSMHKI